jgi:hypothetical protein
MPGNLPLLIRCSQSRAPGAVSFDPGLDLPGAAANRAILYVLLLSTAAIVNLQLHDFATVGALQRHTIIHDANNCTGTGGSPQA